jgi:hypothetical protein
MQSSRSPTLRLCRVGAVFSATVISFVVLGVGCSKDSSKPANSTGKSTDIVFGADAGWTDASVPENITATAACAKYARAVCERKNECGLANDDCVKAVANCPDSMFSQGSTREPGTTWQCAFVMRQRSCEDVYEGVNPPCVTPGTRKPGEACIAPAQCESLACSGSATSCGSCVPRVGKGQGCTNAGCESGLKCDTATYTCVDLPERTFSDIVSTGLEIGKTCDATNNLCSTGAYCKFADGVGTCTARLAEGQACMSSASCIEGTYCFQEGNSCYRLPSAGARCGNDVETGMAQWCTADAFCNADNSLCEPLPVAGQPCGATKLSGSPILCAASSTCDSTVTPPTCKALVGPAETCTDDAECQKGLKCLCPNAACVSKACGVIREVTESCANPGEICNSVSTCSDGTCKANPSQGIYAAVCGG